MVRHFSCVLLFETPWTVPHLAPLSMGFSGQEYWSGLPCPPPGDLPDPGIELMPLRSPALAGGIFTTSATWKSLLYVHICIYVGLPWWLSIKESSCKARTTRHMGCLLDWKDPLEVAWQLQHSCLENPMDRGDWWATVHEATKSQTQLKWLSMNSCMYVCVCAYIYTHSHESASQQYQPSSAKLV